LRLELVMERAECNARAEDRRAEKSFVHWSFNDLGMLAGIASRDLITKVRCPPGKQILSAECAGGILREERVGLCSDPRGRFI
jgi:hypothetical protein